MWMRRRGSYVCEWGYLSSHPIPRCWTFRNQFHPMLGIPSPWNLSDSQEFLSILKFVSIPATSTDSGSNRFPELVGTDSGSGTTSAMFNIVESDVFSVILLMSHSYTYPSIHSTHPQQNKDQVETNWIHMKPSYSLSLPHSQLLECKNQRVAGHGVSDFSDYLDEYHVDTSVLLRKRNLLPLYFYFLSHKLVFTH